MSNSWNNISVLAEVQNSSEIMSEELMRSIEDKEEIKFAEKISGWHENSSNDTPSELLKEMKDASVNNYCDSDAIIAQVLQRQFEKEYDEEVKQVKRKKNGDAKVSVSYENYRHAPDHLLYNSDSNDDFDGVMNDWDRFETNEKEFASLSKRGFVMKDIQINTKHNNVINHNRTACRVMAFPPEMCVGDGAEFDMKLSTYELNNLREQPKYHQTRKNKILDCKESRVTTEMGLDELTREMLLNLINNGVLEGINGVIATGKESVILRANGVTSFPDFTVPEKCAIKVFKTALRDNTTLKEFKARHKYIEADYRFKDRYLKKNPRKVVHMWAQKEMYNMKRLQKIGLNCPDTVCLMKNILVMSYIGHENIPAPRLIDIMLKQEQWQSIYKEVIDAMHKMYKLCNLVHADLSEYNILWWDNKCWFIDVSQSVQPDHPRGLEYLLRDCRNISNFFLKKKVLHVKSAENIFKAITGSKEVDVKKFERVHEDTATNFGIAKNLEDALGTNPKIDEKGNFTCEIVFPKQDDDIGSTSIENT